MRNFADVNLDQVTSVYSGAADRCCCGCAGKHSKTGADEKQTRQIKATFNLLKREIANVKDNGGGPNDCFFLERGKNRVHIVYIA